MSSFENQGVFDAEIFDATPALDAESVLGLKQLSVVVTRNSFLMATRYSPSVEKSLRNSKWLNLEKFEGQSRSVSH